MQPGILQDILEKAREVGAAGNSQQNTDVKLIKMLNSFYLNDLPDDMRILKLKDIYTFNTIRGIDTYPFDFDQWSTIGPPVTCAKGQIILYQDKEAFYAYNFNVQYDFQWAQGNGSPGPYIGQVPGLPHNTQILRSYNNNPISNTLQTASGVFPSNYPPNFNVPTPLQPNISRIQNILITANTATGTCNVTDDGNGNLIGACLAGGTINYVTGQISDLTFTSSIPSGYHIWIQYTKVTLGMPYTILFLQQQFVLRPVPDKGYTIEITAYRLPSLALLGTTNIITPNLDGRPEQMDWWELLSFGIAKKLYQNRLDMEGVTMMQAFIDEKIQQARTRTYGQLGQRQCKTLFRQVEQQQSDHGYGLP